MSDLLSDDNDREPIEDVEIVEVYPVDHPDLTFSTDRLDGAYRVVDAAGRTRVIEFVFDSNDYRLMMTLAGVEVTFRSGESVDGELVVSKTNGEQTLVAIEPDGDIK